MNKSDRALCGVVLDAASCRCTVCRFASFEGSVCSGGDFSCNHALAETGLWQFTDCWEGGTDCWGFRPEPDLSVEDVIEIAGAMLDGAEAWWRNEQGIICVWKHPEKMHR